MVRCACEIDIFLLKNTMSLRRSEGFPTDTIPGYGHREIMRVFQVLKLIAMCVHLLIHAEPESTDGSLNATDFHHHTDPCKVCIQRLRGCCACGSGTDRKMMPGSNNSSSTAWLLRHSGNIQRVACRLRPLRKHRCQSADGSHSFMHWWFAHLRRHLQDQHIHGAAASACACQCSIKKSVGPVSMCCHWRWQSWLRATASPEGASPPAKLHLSLTLTSKALADSEL